MSELVFTDGFITLAAVDLSDHLRSGQINYKGEAKESTAMNANAVKSFLGGLTDWNVDLELNQDFASAKVHATLFSLVGKSVAVVIRPVKSTAVGVTNPNFTGTGILMDYDPVGGKVGDVMVCKCKIQGSGVLTAATS